MKISIIIPVYNTGKYLHKCIESLRSQTYSEIEIILVNDGSTDNSLEIMKRFALLEGRIRIINKLHEGVSAARNIGLEVASGDFISFIDSDDWIDENMYAIMMRQIEESKVDAAYCEWTEEFSDGTSTIKGNDGRKKKIFREDEILACYFQNKVNVRLSSGLLKRKMIENVYFDTNRERGEDMLFCFQTLCQAQGIVYTNMPLYHRFHRLGSLSNRKGFYPEDVGRATCTDFMLEYVKKYRSQHVEIAQAYAFNFYMVILNRLIYYHAENEYSQIYQLLLSRLQALYKDMETPGKQLRKELYFAYKICLLCKPIYYMLMVIYYRYVKKELDSKRQK